MSNTSGFYTNDGRDGQGVLYALAAELGALVDATWAASATTRGERVGLYRRYADGVHRARLTAEMAKMLRISETDLLDQFNANYCDTVVRAMAARLVVERVEAKEREAQAWVDDVLAYNRFDVLQMDIHEAAVTDGDTYLMVSYDQMLERVELTHEPAYNEDEGEGVGVVYDRRGRHIEAAYKVWWEGQDVRRINIYVPGMVHKYRLGDELVLLESEPIVGRNGEVLPVPFVHFKNRGRNRREYGVSELVSVIPLQDALNRTLVSMVMTSELSAFQIRVAKGFAPPAGLAPGSWLQIMPDAYGDDADLLNAINAYTMEQAELVPFIEQANWIIKQMAGVSSTPLPTVMGGDTSSGEALKQREAALLSKVQDAQVRYGNGYEDMVHLAHIMQGVYGSVMPPMIDAVRTVWRGADVRDDEAELKKAESLLAAGYEREYLRLLGYDEPTVDRLLLEKAQASQANLAALVGSVPGFGDFAL